jgi:cytochrome c oxidase cbb3-type subunit 1
VFTVLTLIPLLAIAINWTQTLAGASSNWKVNLPLRFVLFGALAYVLAGALSIADSLPQVSQITHFTFFATARTQLLLYGFFCMTMFGAIYHITPLLTQSDWPRAKWATGHFTLGAVGIALYVASLSLGGILQGRALNDPFLDALHIGLLFFRVSTLGDVLMLAGNCLLALNLGVWLVRCCRACCVPAIVAAVKPQMAEVAR